MDVSRPSLRSPELEDTGPPKAWFLDDDWFHRDLEAVYRPRWLLAGHVSEIAGAGRCLTYSLGTEEALIRMDATGELRAYHNVCSHRGARLCRTRIGEMPTRRIVCPYHGWSYSPADGSLATAAAMHEDFDRGPWGLHPVHVDMWCGLIFVCFAEERPIPVAEYLGTDTLGSYDVDALKVAATKTYEIKANWKIVLENDRECYHCVLNHPELSTTIDWKAWATDDFEGVVRARAAGLEVQRGASDASFTLNGERVCRVPLPRDSDEQPSSFTVRGEPGFALLVTPDHGMMVSPKPVGPSDTEVRVYWLVAADATEGTDYALDSLMYLADVTFQQDQELCEMVQEGMQMPVYRPGPLNRIHQAGQAGLYAWYTEQIRRHFPDEVSMPPAHEVGANGEAGDRTRTESAYARS